MTAERRDAPELFAEFVAKLEAGEPIDFDTWVSDHPEEESQLRELHEGLAVAHSLIRKARGGSFYGHRDEQFAAQSSTLTEGQMVGGYRLVTKIGEGGMGQVWEAEQVSLGHRRVAIKFVRPDRASPRSLQLFQREARAAGRLNHDNIVRVHDYGEDADLAWIAMEFVEGCWTLRDFLEAGAAECLEKEDYDHSVAVFFAQVAHAMDAAHRAGVVHRDLKPQNILVNEDDRPKVTDFGLARIQGEQAILKLGELLGTCDYMSPEQVTAGRIDIDHRTDVFNLGLALYETLTLVHPFRNEDPLRTAENLVTKTPPPPSALRPGIPPELDEACMKALRKDRDARFQSMREFAESLTPAALTDTTTIVRRPGGEPESEAAPKRDWTLPALLACAAVLLYFALGGWLKLDVQVRLSAVSAAPRDSVTANGVEYARPGLAELDALDSSLSAYFPWWDPLPILLAIALTAAAFGGLAGCLRAWRQTTLGTVGVVPPLWLPVLGGLGGLLTTVLVHAVSPTSIQSSQGGVLALLGISLALGYFVTPNLSAERRGRRA